MSCDLCTKSFRKDYLKQHTDVCSKRSHAHDLNNKKTSEEIPFCILCNKRFATKATRDAHMKSHSDEKSLCKQCSQVFSSTKNLTNHFSNYYTGDFECSLCNKSFATISGKTCKNISQNNNS